ncbi:hypothetical protein K438DRAFT_1936294, partial [Mycena galopus ATCC 62051]
MFLLHTLRRSQKGRFRVSWLTQTGSSMVCCPPSMQTLSPMLRRCLRSVPSRLHRKLARTRQEAERWHCMTSLLFAVSCSTKRRNSSRCRADSTSSRRKTLFLGSTKLRRATRTLGRGRVRLSVRDFPS